MKDLYEIELKWEYFNEETVCCKIWSNHELQIEFNGEDFYNIIQFDAHGNEIDGIGGAYTIDGAKLNAEEWVAEQLENFMEKV